MYKYMYEINQTYLLIPPKANIISFMCGGSLGSTLASASVITQRCKQYQTYLTFCQTDISSGLCNISSNEFY